MSSPGLCTVCESQRAQHTVTGKNEELDAVHRPVGGLGVDGDPPYSHSLYVVLISAL